MARKPPEPARAREQRRREPAAPRPTPQDRAAGQASTACKTGSAGQEISRGHPAFPHQSGRRKRLRSARPGGARQARPRSTRQPAARGRKAGAAELTGQIQQILDELSELRGIQTAMQALDAKLDAVLRQVEAPGGRDPGDAVPPGVAVQSPAPLSAEDQAVLEKLETEPPPAENT